MPKLPPNTEKLIAPAVWGGTHWRPVNGMGWLLKNARFVSTFVARNHRLQGTDDDVLLVAFMRDGHVFATP